jgi:hypothetical protein
MLALLLIEDMLDRGSPISMSTRNVPILRGETCISFKRPRLQMACVSRIIRPRLGIRWPLSPAIFRMCLPACVTAK